MRRIYGSGSITIDKSTGKLVARVRINGKMHKKTFQKNQRRDAEHWLTGMKNEKRNVLKITTGEWLLYYIEEYKKNFLRPRSLERVKQSCAKLENLYEIPLATLSASDIQYEINAMINAGLSASTIKKTCDLLKSALNQAIAENVIGTNPVLAVKRPKTKAKNKIEILTRREIGKMFLALRKLQKSKRNTSQRYDMILFFRLLLTTGVRVSELLALKWENVDSENHVIKITGSKSLNSQDVNEPKTASGFRTIPLLSAKTRNMLYKNIGKSDDYVFSNKNGGMMNYQRAFLTWQNARKIANVDKTIHALRHTCISYLLTYANLPIATVSAIAGHSSSAITLDIYTHAVKEYNAKNIL